MDSYWNDYFACKTLLNIGKYGRTLTQDNLFWYILYNKRQLGQFFWSPLTLITWTKTAETSLDNSKCQHPLKNLFLKVKDLGYIVCTYTVKVSGDKIFIWTPLILSVWTKVVEASQQRKTVIMTASLHKSSCFCLYQGLWNLILEGRCPAEFSSNLPQHTCLGVSSIPSKTFISCFRFWLGLELNSAGTPALQEPCVFSLQKRVSQTGLEWH